MKLTLWRVPGKNARNELKVGRSNGIRLQRKYSPVQPVVEVTVDISESSKLGLSTEHICRVNIPFRKLTIREDFSVPKVSQVHKFSDQCMSQIPSQPLIS